MAKIFKGFKQVTFDNFNSTADKEGYLWFVRTPIIENEGENETNNVDNDSYDIYFGSKHYGHFRAQEIDKIKESITELNQNVADIISTLENLTEIITANTEKLATIEEGAQVNIIEKIKVNGEEVEVDGEKTVDITVPFQSVSAKTEQILTLSNDGVLDTTLTIDYNSDDKKIYLKGVNGATISSIDATDFIKDGMIDSVVLEEGKEDEEGSRYLVITWNTDAGKDVTRLDVSELFNPYQAGNGIELSENTFSLKIKEGEKYVSVDENGLQTTEELWTEIDKRDTATYEDAKKYVDDNFVNNDTFKPFEEKLEAVEEGAQVNIIENIKVNGIEGTVDEENKISELTISTDNINLGTNITGATEDDVVYTTGDTISSVLQGIQNSIIDAVNGSLASIEAGDGITVSEVAENKQTVSVNISSDEGNMIKISETDKGIFAAMYYDGDDTEE